MAKYKLVDMKCDLTKYGFYKSCRSWFQNEGSNSEHLLNELAFNENGYLVIYSTINNCWNELKRKDYYDEKNDELIECYEVSNVEESLYVDDFVEVDFELFLRLLNDNIIEKENKKNGKVEL